MTTTTTDRQSTFTMTRTVPGGFDAVLAATRSALADQGFGVITEIDLAATLHTKLGVSVPAQVILGACNPGFAHQATQQMPSIAAMLPCNVVVRATDDADHTVVEMFDPAAMARLADDPDLGEVAARVRRDLAAALHAIAPGR